MHRRRSDDFLAELARAYYELNQTQEHVAAQFGISRSQVSRYLSEARDAGIVQIRIVAPAARSEALEGALRIRYPHLREVVVASAFTSDPTTLRQSVARATARLIERVVKPGMTIGTGAGRTLAATVDLLARRPIQNITVAQAMGNAGHEGLDIDYLAVAQRVAAAFEGRALQINAPAILGSGLRAADLEASNRPIRDALEQARRADLYLLGVGSIGGDQIYVTTGLIKPAELEDLGRAGAVGDLCGNFYDIGGAPLASPFAERAVGIRLGDLRRAPMSLATGGGLEKVAAITGALEGRFVNALATDEHTARGVLELAGPRGRRTAGPSRSDGAPKEEEAR